MGRKGKKPPNPNVVVGSNTPSLLEALKTKKVLVFILLFLVIGASVGGSYWYFARTTTKQSKNVCNSGDNGYISQAAAAVSTLDYQKLKVVSETIESVADYDKDPNCIYPVFEYYIYIHDADKSQALLNKFETVFNPDMGLDSQYSSTFTGLEGLKQQVEFVNNFNRDFQNNALYTN